MYSDADRSILDRYVTDPAGNVYAIHNLPEEVIAVIFAYVSRSPYSFRDNLLDLIRGRSLDLGAATAEGLAASERESGSHYEAREKARHFHEKWVVGYGHSSVAEHAVAHVGVERISRLASAELELSNPYLSFTEYSQRYQRPQPGGYVIPQGLQRPELSHLREEFQSFCDFSFAQYERLQAGLLEHLLRSEPELPGERLEGRRARLEKLSFEDARYALPLAVHSNLGLTGNGRALRDALVRLLSSSLPEVRELADALRREVSKVLPALLRHAEPSPYWERQQEAGGLDTPGRTEAANASARVASGPRAGKARLLDYTGRKAGEAAAAVAMRRVLTAWLARRQGPRGAAGEAYLAGLNPTELTRLYEEAAGAFSSHDLPGEEFKQVRYSVEFVVSEANWHQLLRHARKVDFYPARPGTGHGYTVPPRLAEAGLTPLLEEVLAQSEALVERLQAPSPESAAYAVTNAHRRPVLAEFDLWEWVHLSRQRCKPDAQWDIRQTMWQLMDQIRSVHGPLLAPLSLPSRVPTA